MYRLRESVVESISCDYANNEIEVAEVLDCSLGVNPYGMNDSVVQQLKNICPSDIAHYPHNDAIRARIADRFRKVFPGISADNVLLANGSMDILRKLNMAVVGEGGSVIGVEPRFSAYVDDLFYVGAHHIAYTLEQKNNYRFDTDAFLEKYEKNPACQMVCIENPHNPTGQIIPVEEIERIAFAAEKRGVFLVIDEAYGDYMPLENSAAALISTNPNILVTRSFSKGYGMAGIRLGYLLADKNVANAISKVFLPFDCNSIGRLLGMRALDDLDYCPRLMKQVASDKEKILNKLEKLQVAQTAATTPIMMLYHPDRKTDLYQLLLQNGIKTISGKGFQTLSKNCVRMMVCADAERQAEILGEVERQI